MADHFDENGFCYEDPAIIDFGGLPELSEPPPKPAPQNRIAAIRARRREIFSGGLGVELVYHEKSGELCLEPTPD